MVVAAVEPLCNSNVATILESSLFVTPDPHANPGLVGRAKRECVCPPLRFA
jgi:hypothetical protein